MAKSTTPRASRTSKTVKHDAHVTAQQESIVCTDATEATPEVAAMMARTEAEIVQAEKAIDEAAKIEPAPEPIKVETNAVRYYLKDDHRPAGQGEMGKVRLFAHTSAFLKVSGLMEGKPVPSLYANRALGSTAMQHHKAKFTSTPAGLMLTDAGKEFFAKRPVNAEFEAAYISTLTKGTPDGSMVKLPQAIGEFKA